MDRPEPTDTSSATPEGSPQPEPAVEYEPPPRTIGWKKGLVIVVAVSVVYAVVEICKTTGNEIPWGSDLPQALSQGQKSQKAVVLLIHKNSCPIMVELDQTVFNLASTYEWAMGGVPVRLKWEEHPEVVKRYRLTQSPTLIVLNPTGEVVWQMVAYDITPQIRKRFLTYAVGHKDDSTYRRDKTDPNQASK